jgi:hypothetical protein
MRGRAPRPDPQGNVSSKRCGILPLAWDFQDYAVGATLFWRAFMGVTKPQLNRSAIDLQPLIDHGHVRDWEKRGTDSFQWFDFFHVSRRLEIASLGELFSAFQQPLGTCRGVSAVNFQR